MSELDAKIAELKSMVEAAQIKKIRAEANLQAAQANRQNAMDALQQQFGLDSLSDARAKLAELRGSLTDKITELENGLRMFKE